MTKEILPCRPAREVATTKVFPRNGMHEKSRGEEAHDDSNPNYRHIHGKANCSFE